MFWSVAENHSQMKYTACISSKTESTTSYTLISILCFEMRDKATPENGTSQNSQQTHKHNFWWIITKNCHRIERTAYVKKRENCSFKSINFVFEYLLTILSQILTRERRRKKHNCWINEKITRFFLCCAVFTDEGTIFINIVVIDRLVFERPQIDQTANISNELLSDRVFLRPLLLHTHSNSRIESSKNTPLKCDFAFIHSFVHLKWLLY